MSTFKPKTCQYSLPTKYLITFSNRAVQFLQRTNHILQHILPSEFSAHCRLANISGDTLIIHTDNASYASLIRFHAPTLCKTVSTELAITINKLVVKVASLTLPIEQTSSHSFSLSQSASENIEATANSMEEGALKTALEKLAQRQPKS